MGGASLAENEEWQGVNPDVRDVWTAHMPEGVAPVAAIAYAPEYVEAVRYLAAVEASGEVSERVLSLTAQVIDECEGHYGAWCLRRRVVLALADKEDGRPGHIARELAFARQCTVERPKNYQLWRHREALVDALIERGCLADEVLGAELADLELVLGDEAKNYHAWQHRAWLLRRCAPLSQAAWLREFRDTEKMLREDPRNNSAWSYRLLLHCLGLSSGVCPSDESEAAFIDECAAGDVDNVSVWRYAAARLGRHSSLLGDLLSRYPMGAKYVGL